MRALKGDWVCGVIIHKLDPKVELFKNPKRLILGINKI